MINIRLYMPSDITGMGMIWNRAVSDGDSLIQDEALPYLQAGRFFASQNAAVVATDETGTVRGLYTIRAKYSGRCKHICSAVIIVDNEFRRRHIGEMLLKDCVERSSRLGFRVMELYPVSSSNKAASGLFEKAGFTKTGSIPEGFIRGDGQYTDAETYCIALPEYVNENAVAPAPAEQRNTAPVNQMPAGRTDMPGQAAFAGQPTPVVSCTPGYTWQSQAPVRQAPMNGNIQGQTIPNQNIPAQNFANQTFPNQTFSNQNIPNQNIPAQNNFRAGKPEKSISSTNLVFGAGVLLLTIAAAVFLSVSWQMMSDVARVVTLIGVLAAVFATSYLAGSVLKLKQTGFAFYTLGSLLTPILIVGMGALNLLGSTFSFNSGNGFLVTAVGMLAFSIVTFLGSKIYESSAYSGMTYFGFTWMVMFLGVQLGRSSENSSVLVSAVFTADILAFLVMTAALFDFSQNLKFFRTYANIVAIVSAVMTFTTAAGLVVLLMFDTEVNAKAVVIAIGLLLITIVFIEAYKGFEKGIYSLFAYLAFTFFIIYTAYLTGTEIGGTDIIGRWRAIVLAIDLLAIITAVLSKIGKIGNIRYFKKYAFTLSMISFVVMLTEFYVHDRADLISSPAAVLTGAVASLASVLIFAKSKTDGISTVSKHLAPFSACVTTAVFVEAFDEIFDPGAAPVVIAAALAYLFIRILFVVLNLETLLSDIVFALLSVGLVVSGTVMGSDMLTLTMFPLIAALFSGFTAVRPGGGRNDIVKRGNSVISGIFSVFAIMLLPWNFTQEITALWAGMIATLVITIALLIIRIKKKAMTLIAYLYSELISALVVSLFGMIIAIAVEEPYESILIVAILFSAMMWLLVAGTVMGAREKNRIGVALKSSLIVAINSMIFLFANLDQVLFRDGYSDSSPTMIMMLAFLIIVTVVLKLIPACSSGFGTIMGIIDSIWLLIGAGSLGESMLMLALFAVAIAITVFFTANRFFTVVPIIVAIFALGNQLKDLDLSSGELNIIILIAAVACAALGRMIYRDRWGDKKGIDYLAFSPALIVCYMDGSEPYVKLLVFAVLAAMFFNMMGRNLKGDKIFMSAGLCFIALSIASTSEMIDYPEGMLTEFYICIVLALVLAIRYLVQPLDEVYMELIWFITVGIALVVEGFSAANTGYVSDLLITGIASFGIFIYAFIVKSKKWFILGLIAILLIAVYLSATFWASIAWMLYLLIAGIVLIAIAALNEWGRKHASEGERKRFFEEWKW